MAAQVVKMALAAVVACLLATATEPSQSFIAPYAAVFVISQTVYRSFVQTVRQLAVIVMGVVIAFLSALLVPWQVGALAVSVLAGMLVGQWKRLGASGIWVGIIALLMVTSGSADDVEFLLLRVLESAIGVGAGTLVNLLILPPIGVRRAANAITDLSERIRRLLYSIADEITSEWGPAQADEWNERAEAIFVAAGKAEKAGAHERETARFNVRWRVVKRRTPSIAPAEHGHTIDTLYDVSVEIRRITGYLVGIGRHDALSQTSHSFTDSLAVFLHDLGAAIDGYRTKGRPSEELAGLVDDSVARLTDAHADVIGSDGAASSQGALLLSCDIALRRVRDDLYR